MWKIKNRLKKWEGRDGKAVLEPYQLEYEYEDKNGKTTKVKEPVDPKLILQESEKEMAKRMMRENKEAIKRFIEKLKPRDDKATGGLANLSQTYDNNPPLQSQFPNKQDYLDLFSSTTTTTTAALVLGMSK